MKKTIKLVFWTSRAVNDLEKITRFNILLYGFEKAINIDLDIQKTTEILENPANDFMEIGVIDTEFLHLKRNYRKLINHHCKITYREGKTKI